MSATFGPALGILVPKVEALPGVLGNRGNMAFISGEQRPNFEGSKGTKTILGNREHSKTNFRFLGNRGTSQFISGEQGNRYPPGRVSRFVCDFGIFWPYSF